MVAPLLPTTPRLPDLRKPRSRPVFASIQSQWRWWIGERFQCLTHGEKKLWRMCNGYVVDLIVIRLRIAMREYVAEPDDVTGVRNCFRNRRRHSVEIAHGFAADFQHALHCRSGFLVRHVLL